MVRKLTLLTALLCALSLTAGVSAQADSTPVAFADEFEYGYVRVYADMASLESGTPPAAGEAVGYMAGVLKPIDADAMEENFRSYVDDVFASGFFRDADEQPKAEEIDDLGDEAYEYISEMDGIPVTAIMVRDGDLALLAVTMGVGESGASTDLAQYMVDADPGDDEVTFSDDGTSTGGAFDVLPEGGDDAVNGFDAAMDMDMMVEGM